MDYTSYILLVVYAIGLVQGLLLITIIHLFKHRKRSSSVYLTILIICFLTLIVSEELQLLFPFDQVLFTFRTGEAIPLLIGPLLYLYMQSVLKKEHVFSPYHLLHFSPFVVSFLAFLPFYLESNDDKLSYIEMLDTQGPPTWMIIFTYAKGIYSLAYFVMAIFFIRADSRNTKNEYSTRARNLLRNLTLIQIASMVLIYMMVALESQFDFIESDQIASVIFSLAFIIFTLIIILYRSILIPDDPTKIKELKYQQSGMSEMDKQAILNQLLGTLENDRSYLNPEMSLQIMSQNLNVTANQLSQVVNEKLDKNFQTLLNEYRVKEVKQNINDDKRSLLGIALDAGFSSKSAFNRVFKEITGITPSEYKKLQVKK